MSQLGTGVSKGGSYKCGGIPMDSLITAAARALARGDLLGTLNRVACATTRLGSRCEASHCRDGTSFRRSSQEG
jgi:hypothetical protein